MSEVLGRRRKNLKFDKSEKLLIIRSYQAHPANFPDVVKTIQENLSLLPPVVRTHYETQGKSKLLQRVREKFQKMIDMGDSDQELQEEINAVKDIERTLVESIDQPPRQQRSPNHTRAERSKSPPPKQKERPDNTGTVRSSSKVQQKRRADSSEEHHQNKRPTGEEHPSTSRQEDDDDEQSSDIRLKWSRKIAKKIEKVPSKRRKAEKRGRNMHEKVKK